MSGRVGGTAAGPGERLHVLVVDDSAVVREAMTAILARDGKMAVTVASDPLIAMKKMEGLRPDVIVLDLEMPRMDGLTFLRTIMGSDPIPVVVCSALSRRGSEAALRALEEGAVDVVAKPTLGVRGFLHESAISIVEAVRGAASARVGSSRARLGRGPKEVARPDVAPATQRHALRTTTERVVAIGASTGGTEALRLLLEAMPPDCPGLVIVQHMPALFTKAFADRLAQICRIAVKEAADGDRVLRGRALIAPGNRHVVVRRSGAFFDVALEDGDLVSRHRPSVDVLFHSVAAAAGASAVGVIMTGMGADGAAGLAEMRRAGAATIAQDEASSVVFGMPREAILRGAAESVVSLPLMAGAILAAAGRGAPGREGSESHDGNSD